MEGLELYVLINWKAKTYQLIVREPKVKFSNSLRAVGTFCTN